MRTETPSRTWLRAFDAAFIAAGGHGKPQTLNAVRRVTADEKARIEEHAEAAGMHVSAYIRRAIGLAVAA